MVHAANAVGVLLVLAALFCTERYLSYRRRSRAIVSTSEWVKLMRENDLQIARSARARAAKSRPSKLS
jgi:hypothetical protein